MLNITTISEKGQIVVPKKIRDILGIKPSDSLTVSLNGRRIVVEPTFSLNDVYGVFKARGKITKKDIKESAQKYTLRKHKLSK